MNNKPIRILHVVARMDYGGTETLLMNLYRSIDKSQVQFDFAVCTNTEAPYDKEIKEMGGNIYYYPRYLIKNHFEYKKWWNNFFKNEGKDYKIVHGHIGSTAAIYLKIAKKYKKFTIAHSHGTNDSIDSLKSLLYRVYSYPVRFIADSFLGCSKQALADRYGKNIFKSKKNVMVLNNGIFVDKYKFDINKRIAKREELGIDEECYLVGHVGRYTKAKNPLFMLEVFSDILKYKPESKFLYIGKGEMEFEIDQKIKALNLETKVIRIKETSKVEDYLQAMDVFIFPSLFEGLGISAIEAQASGLNVFASDNLPLETKVTNLIHYLSLDLTSSQWAQEMLKYDYKNREIFDNRIKASGFDIKDTACNLVDFYMKNCN